MTYPFHAVVYLDHSSAKAFAFDSTKAIEHKIDAATASGTLHHKAGTVGSGHDQDRKSYWMDIAKVLEPSREILVVGHGTAKTEFAHFVRDHVPLLMPRIVGVETLDKATDGEIVAFARKFFEHKDRMTPQR